MITDGLVCRRWRRAHLATGKRMAGFDNGEERSKALSHRQWPRRSKAMLGERFTVATGAAMEEVLRWSARPLVYALPQKRRYRDLLSRGRLVLIQENLQIGPRGRSSIVTSTQRGLWKQRLIQRPTRDPRSSRDATSSPPFTGACR